MLQKLKRHLYILIHILTFMIVLLQYLETSVWKLKFAPDWDSAANELNKAAVAFRVGQSPAQAKDAHLRAAEAYANNGNLYHAGKQLDQV